jgi:hypothetical protein
VFCSSTTHFEDVKSHQRENEYTKNARWEDDWYSSRLMNHFEIHVHNKKWGMTLLKTKDYLFRLTLTDMHVCTSNFPIPVRGIEIVLQICVHLFDSSEKK